MNNNETAQHLELSKVEQPEEQGIVLTQRDFGLVKNVPVRLDVMLGTHQIEIEKLFKLRAGEVLKLDKEVDQPIELILNNEVVAFGSLVAVDGHFGIEITDVKGAK